ncbi:MAG TPA: AbrB family transcriptional regulator [Xanthobacteraceae bacterium]|jgi:membrane AbrB-like protein|nr:AbrB family transcriptional regulator [Xanthobacteraceae bacterium]
MPALTAVIKRLPVPAQWSALAALSAAIVACLELAGLPATFLIGPMVAAVIIATNGGALRLPKFSFFISQAAIGCLVAHSIPPSLIGGFAQSWPLFLSIGSSILLASLLLGWLIGRLGVIPGTTAIWGMAPGAASAMMLMAGEFGADARLVAFMQYLRVVIVAALASLIARFWVHIGDTPLPPLVWFAPLDGAGFAKTLVLAIGGGLIGRLSRIPGGTFLVPMIAGIALQATGIMTIVLPTWFLAACFALLGWNIGLGFTPQILSHTLRALPQTLIAIFTLIGFSILLAAILVHTLGVDPLTAYLGTSPGGMDAIAIIAASTPVDVPLVMGLQIFRFVIVLLAGPPLARLIAGQNRKAKKRRPDRAAERAIQQVKDDEAELD